MRGKGWGKQRRWFTVEADFFEGIEKVYFDVILLTGVGLFHRYQFKL